MASQRRLPNGRFAKVIDLPPARTKAFQKGQGPKIIVQTNALAQLQKIHGLNQRVSAQMSRNAEDQASRIQTRLQTEAAIAYPQGTGRFARGLKATVKNTGSPDQSQHVIRVTMVRYRESEFLTNIGGSGRFKDFPVGPYRIYARGAEGFDTLLNSTTGEVKRTHQRRAASRARANRAGRLKVPKAGVYFTSFKTGTRGHESRKAVGMPTDLEPDGMGGFKGGGNQFFYPLWVNHPGFKRDVVSEVAEAEGARFEKEQIGAFRTEASRTKFLGDSQMTVSREIPIITPTITLRSSRRSL